MLSGTYHCRGVVGCHDGDRWQLRACAKGSGSWLFLRFLRGFKIKQLFTCTPTKFSTPCLHSILWAPTYILLRRWLNPLNNAGLQELANRILPICENYLVVSQFVEARSHFKHGLTSHAFASGLRAILQVSKCLRLFSLRNSWRPNHMLLWWQLSAICDHNLSLKFESDEVHSRSYLLCLQDYHAMVAQLDHQFRLGRLSLPGLWFFVQVTLSPRSFLGDRSSCVYSVALQYILHFCSPYHPADICTQIVHIQPMIGAMQCLSTVLQTASVEGASGAALLNLLHNQVSCFPYLLALEEFWGY